MVANSTSGARFVPGAGGEVLLLSMRRLHDLVAFCAAYEFEDVFAEVTGADRVEPLAEGPIESARRAYRAVRLLTRSPRLARTLAPGPPAVHLDRDYDLFFPIFSHAHELFALASVPDWRRRSRVAACFINELWASHLPEYLLELLAEFDHVFIGVHNAVPEVARIVGRPCTYLPLATDVLTFAPSFDAPARPFDVCYIGRRSPVTHQALYQLARARRIRYYFDTVAASGDDMKQRTFRVESASEHRFLLATLLQSSRYFVANPARVNEPSFVSGQEEISARYYEGAAAGTVMIGLPPRVEVFRRSFDWPDAVIEIPFDAPEIGRVLEQLDRDPERLQSIRVDGVRNSALRHDWLHRIETAFAELGLKPTEGMRQRARRLAGVASEAAAATPGARVAPPAVPGSR